MVGLGSLMNFYALQPQDNQHVSASRKFETSTPVQLWIYNNTAQKWDWSEKTPCEHSEGEAPT